MPSHTGYECLDLVPKSYPASSFPHPSDLGKQGNDKDAGNITVIKLVNWDI
jgi:hypothetical protein